MIVPPYVLYEITDCMTGHRLYCYPVRPMNLSTMFTSGARADRGYEIRVNQKIIAQVSADGTIEPRST